MRLRQLLEVLPEPVTVGRGQEMEIEIQGITDDSREAAPGSLFVAVRGENTDGHDHVQEAVERGAVAVVTERPMSLKNTLEIQARDSVEALARLSACFFEYPSEEMTLVGITGTNGKTTTSLLVQSILEESGKKTGLIGTLRYEIGEEVLPALNTTPNILRINSLLHRMSARGLKACVMEVSSHALALGRVRGTHFDTRIFTNLTRDHLDFHASMEDYYASKRQLFQEGFGKTGGHSVINADDPWGERLIRECAGPLWTYGIRKKADFMAMDMKNTIHGLCFRVSTPEGELEVESALVGIYNIYNILSAVAVGFAMGVPEAAILRGIAKITKIPGRFEKIAGPGFTVAVDYAHTHDALKSLLENARQLCDGRLVTIFGCGGDRDRGKRPLMGKVAAESSDVIIVTSDNPRTEDPGIIIDDILAGIEASDPFPVKVVQDRRQAIRQGIREARPGDIVVVAGKGHEDYQIIGKDKIHFDDREEVRAALRQLQGSEE